MGYVPLRSSSLTRWARRWLLPCIVLLLLVTIGRLARAQSVQFLPEIDTYLTLNPLVRVSFQVKETREGGDPTQAEIGPSIDFYLKPWVKLQRSTTSDLDDAKKRVLVLSTGYRVLPSANAATEQRLELVATTNYPLGWHLLLSDRNRADLDWTNGDFSWRYRNRLTLEKPFVVGRYHPSVYVRSEVFYESQYEKWSTTALYVGGIFPFGKRFDISPYYDHQNNTGKNPNQQLNQIGLIGNFYFSVPKRKP